MRVTDSGYTSPERRSGAVTISISVDRSAGCAPRADGDIGFRYRVRDYGGYGLGFKVQGLGFAVLGFRVCGFRV